MTHPEVERVFLQLDIVGADIDGHRQTPGGMNPGTGGIKRQLTDRYAHPGNTIIMVTHEDDIAHYAHRIVRLRDGLVETDKVNKDIFTSNRIRQTV